MSRGGVSSGDQLSFCADIGAIYMAARLPASIRHGVTAACASNGIPVALVNNGSRARGVCRISHRCMSSWRAAVNARAPTVV